MEEMKEEMKEEMMGEMKEEMEEGIKEERGERITWILFKTLEVFFDFLNITITNTLQEGLVLLE